MKRRHPVVLLTVAAGLLGTLERLEPDAARAPTIRRCVCRFCLFYNVEVCREFDEKHPPGYTCECWTERTT